MTTAADRDIIIAYADVHQAYQLALAAETMGRLRSFYCSLFYRVGPLGRHLGFLGGRSFENRFVPGIPPERVCERFWPFFTAYILERISRKVGRRNVNLSDWRNRWFDRIVARRLPRDAARMFVGVEGCAAEAMAAAKRLGMTTVLECPHPSFAMHREIVERSISELGFSGGAGLQVPSGIERRQRERELADYILTTSEIQRREIAREGYPAERIFSIPLWADERFVSEGRSSKREDRLSVLYVGQISIHKGLTYLFRAVAENRDVVDLRVAGARGHGSEAVLKTATVPFQYLGSLNKAQLLDAYQGADVLVLPSLYETFGFVAMEAMRCGTPVIVTENCGVPVPEMSWRVPVRHASAISNRLRHYAKNRAALEADGILAASFAKQFTSAAYRGNVQATFKKITLLSQAATGKSALTADFGGNSELRLKN